MILNNNHLTLDEYMKFIENLGVSDRTIKIYKKLYELIIDEWQTPCHWIDSSNKIIFYQQVGSNIYWYVWSLCKNEKLPLEFIKNKSTPLSKKVLKTYLSDYDKLEKTILNLKNNYEFGYSEKLYSKVLKICLFLGVNNIGGIKLDELSKAYVEGILDRIHLYYMDILIQNLGNSDAKSIKNQTRNKIIRQQKRNNKKRCWSSNMETIIDEFLNDMENSRIGSRMSKEKKSHLKKFGVWLFDNSGSVLIEDLKYINRDKWLEYVYLTIGIVDLAEKTRIARLTTIIQFFDWLKIKRRCVISNELEYNRDDFKILSSNNNDIDLAFEKREHGEKILDYLINDYKTINTTEEKVIRDEFCKEAIIICANSGMRISEIINMKYGSVFFSEDEGHFKMILEYEDKLGQVNRPVYFTKDGYEAIKRLEELRRKSGKLEEKYNERTETRFIHLFEYEGKNPIDKTYIYDFLTKVKYLLNLVDKNGRCVKGGVHAYRHFFGMTVFRLSNYNISVVRYLLGHRSYTMSERYIVEEDKPLFSKIREEKDSEKIAGKGIDTFYNFVFENITKQERFNKLERYISSSEYLKDIINEKNFKKVSLGYCINPCGKENKCFKCNNFLVTEKEKKELFSFLKDLIAIIGCKVEKTGLSLEDAISIPLIASDVDDTVIIIEELKNLGVTDVELNEQLND